MENEDDLMDSVLAVSESGGDIEEKVSELMAPLITGAMTGRSENLNEMRLGRNSRTIENYKLRSVEIRRGLGRGWPGFRLPPKKGSCL